MEIAHCWSKNIAPCNWMLGLTEQTGPNVCVQCEAKRRLRKPVQHLTEV